ncbi:MAG: AAA domain-containing protein [Prevotella sp.]|nr:AAA domain-containing protein [Prevotella sp.]
MSCCNYSAPSRMNVAMTRARSKLIIIGDHKTLSHNSFYDKLYKYVQDTSLSLLP